MLGSPLARRLLGGMMATPWFAVSAGLLIAGWLALESPGAQLTFPASPQATCKTDECLPAGRASGSSGPGPWAAGVGTKPGSVRHLTGGAASQLIITGGAPGPWVRYSVRHMGPRFVVFVELVGRRDLRQWTLRVEFPGSRVDMVLGANWAPDGPGAGTISGTLWPWQRSGSSTIRLDIFGTGGSGTPAGCVLNGKRCSFHLVAGHQHG